jgi:hypothetical protein
MMMSPKEHRARHAQHGTVCQGIHCKYRRGRDEDEHKDSPQTIIICLLIIVGIVCLGIH